MWDIQKTPQNPEQNPQGADGKKFINTSNLFGKNWGWSEIENLFADIKNEAWNATHKPKWSILVGIAGLLSAITVLLIIGSILVFGDYYLKTREDNSLIVSYPFLCNYIVKWVVDNNEEKCETLSMIRNRVTTEKNTLSAWIIERLHTYIPVKVQENSFSFSSSPEKKLIDKVISERIMISDIISQFEKLQKQTTFQWADIECSALTITELWSLKTSCEIYGLWLWAKSSRIEAAKFIEKFSRPDDAWFIMLKTPKYLGISEYNNTSDGWIKAIFSTKTPLSLELQYNNTQTKQ